MTEKRCPHGVRWPHECRECEAAIPDADVKAFAERMELDALRAMDNARDELAAVKASHNYLTFMQVKKERDDLRTMAAQLAEALQEIRLLMHTGSRTDALTVHFLPRKVGQIDALLAEYKSKVKPSAEP